MTRKEIQELVGWYNWAIAEKFRHPLLLIANFIFEYQLSEKQLQFWQWVKRQEVFSRKTAIDALGFAPRTIEAMTRKLLDMGKLERLGQGHATRYRVTD